MVKLERCPVCGGKALLHPDFWNGKVTMNTRWRVTCQRCDFGTTIGTRECVLQLWRLAAERMV